MGMNPLQRWNVGSWNNWKRKSDGQSRLLPSRRALHARDDGAPDALPVVPQVVPPNVPQAVDAADGLAAASAVSAPIANAPRQLIPLPTPALKWIGAGGRIALRSFHFSSDADAVCAFQQETYTLNFPDFRYTEAFEAAFRHDLRRATLDPHHALFVLDDGEIVGFMWLVVCQNTWTNERYGYINNLYLSPQRRGQNLGRELMEQSDAFFRSRHIQRSRLTVTASNLPAVHLYENCGFEVTRWEMEKQL